MKLQYVVHGDASRAGLRALLYRATRQAQLEINNGRGSQRVVFPDTGTFQFTWAEIFLYISDFRAQPRYLTWSFLLEMLETSWFCFVEQALYYELQAEVFVNGVYSGFIAVSNQEPHSISSITNER